MIPAWLVRTSCMATKTPKTVSDWQLYHGYKGSYEAACKLTSALKKAERQARKGLKKARTTKDAEAVLGKAMWDIVGPVMSKYASNGASDTEPRNVAMGYLEKVGHEFGFYGYLNF